MATIDEEKKRLYGGSYDQEISDVYNKMQTRPGFSYDLDGDALYQQYKDRYTENAKQSMKDTMGQAASLTGGYGSSYAQGVGQQRYDETMRGLTDMIPTLEQNAYQKYRDQGEALMNQYNMLMNLGATEQATNQAAYERLYALIGSTGYQATPEELAAAGMSQEAADALRNEYLRQTGQLPKSGGGGGGGWGGSGGNGDTPPADDLTYEEALRLLRENGASENDILKFQRSQGKGRKGGGSNPTNGAKQSQRER